MKNQKKGFFKANVVSKESVPFKDEKTNQQEVFKQSKIIRTRKTLKALKNHQEKMNACQRMHVQNHAYANKSRCTYVRGVCQLLNP